MRILPGRPIAFAATWLAVVATAPQGLAAEPSLFPESTFFYLEVDAPAISRGMRGLDVARLLAEDEVAEFMAPLFASVPNLDPRDPIGGLIEKLALGDWLAGKAAIGFAGIEFGDESAPRLRLAPDSPLSARMINALIARSDSDVPKEIRFDALATLIPGAELRALAEQFLEQPEDPFRVEETSIDGHAVHVLDVDLGNGASTRFFAAIGDTQWLIAGTVERLRAALSAMNAGLGDPSAFPELRARATAGELGAFAVLDVKHALSALRHVSPLFNEELELLGIDSLRSLALGMSFVEGGVRESLLVGFDGKPRGFLAALDAFGGGFATLAEAPGDTGFFAGLRFDPAILVERMRDAVAAAFPDALAKFDQGLAELEIGGMSAVEEIFPAFGDEISVALTVPRAGFIPDAVMRLSLRDGERFDALLAKLLEQIGGAESGVEIRPLPISEDLAGFSVMIPDAPVQPAFCRVGDQFLGAMTGMALRTLVKQGDGAAAGKTLRSDDPTLAVLRRGFAGIDAGAAGLWLHLDLARILPFAYGYGQNLLPMLAQEQQLPLDASLLPLEETLTPYFKGIAIALHRDDVALSLDMFSPVGVLGGLLLASQAQQDGPSPH
jgi:hypothetical protein